jgi:hypothetical protein
MSALFDNTFGNYMLHGMDEIVVPAPIAWWPQTIGWQLLGLGLALWAIYRAYRAAQTWWRNRYRRSALARLDQLLLQAGAEPGAVLPALPKLLKATALQAYPRGDVAALSGSAWLAFLDDHYPGPKFNAEPGKKLLSIAYRAESSWQVSNEDAAQLIAMTRQWLRQHRASATGDTPGYA